MCNLAIWPREINLYFRQTSSAGHKMLTGILKEWNFVKFVCLVYWFIPEEKRAMGERQKRAGRGRESREERQGQTTDSEEQTKWQGLSA